MKGLFEAMRESWDAARLIARDRHEATEADDPARPALPVERAAGTEK